MSRTTPMWLLCKGEKSRVRDGPAFCFSVVVSVYPRRRGLVCWFGKWPRKLAAFYTQPEAKVRGNQHEESRVRDGSAFCFSGAV